MEDYQVSEREIAYGSFLTRNRRRIFSLLRWSLIVIDVGLIVWLGIVVFGILRTEMAVNEQAQAMAQGIVRFASVEEASPQAIDVLSTTAFKTTEVYADVVAEVRNPNEDWAVYEGTFTLTVGGREMTASTQILPGEKKYVAVTNIDVGAGANVSTPNLTFTDIEWQRIKDTRDYPEEIWTTKSATYETVTTGEGDEAVSSGLVSAQVTNQAILGFREAEVMLVLLQGNRPVGVRIQRVPDWPSFETKNLKFTWPKAFSINVSPVVQVDTNVLDQNNIITEVETEEPETETEE